MSNLREKISDILMHTADILLPEREELADAILEAISSESAARPVERKAPVQGYQAGIPWSLHLEAYDDYAKKYGTSQTAERLAERGGFGARELDEHIPGWRDKVSTIADLQARLEAAEAERDALRKDAERCQFVAQEPGWGFVRCLGGAWPDGWGIAHIEDIDAALSKKGPQA